MGIWLDAAERDRLGRAVLVAWPERRPASLTWLAEGFGSAAYESPDGLIVLAAKNEIGAHARRVTVALTPEIAPLLEVGVPVPLWRLESAPGLPFGAYVYSRLPGRVMTEADVVEAPASMAAQIGEFLRVLHSFPVSRAIDAGLPGFEELWDDLASLRASTDPALQRRLTSEEYARVGAWWDGFLKDPALIRAPRCVVHGDLWPQNMLADEKGDRLLGIIDFGEASVVDTAYDFACLRLSPALFDGALASYRDRGGVTDGGFEHRVERWWELRCGSWYSLRAALRTDDAAEIDDAIGQLRRSPILVS